MRHTKIITGNAYLADQKKQNFFSKEELNLILSLYGKGVSSGKWKDYAIDSSNNETIFSIKRPKETKAWKILNGTYAKQTQTQKDVERLIAAIQQELEWDDKDIATHLKIQKGLIDWSGNVRSKRKPRKHIRKCS